MAAIAHPLTLTSKAGGKMKKLLLALPLLISCTTYHSSGATGGYSETQLGPRIYQVRFQGNGYTQNDRVSVFLLRRSAELTLENGFRYFTLTGQQTQTGHSMGYNFPNQSTTVRFLDALTDDPGAMDAVTVIHETNDAAGGRLSSKAREALDHIPRS